MLFIFCNAFTWQSPSSELGFLVRWNAFETIRACTTGLVTLDEHLSEAVKDGFPETSQLLTLIDRHFGLEELRSTEVKEK